MNTKDFFLLLLAIIIGATVANLIALKIAAVQVQAQLDSSVQTNPLLALFAK